MGRLWAQKEFASVNFGDRRISDRFKRVGQRIFEKPMSSINEACAGWKDTKAAYRLFDNDQVNPERIMDAHRVETIRRMSKEARVYAIQDTTFFNYHAHRARTDMGIIESKSRPLRGLIAHNVLMLSEQDVPLGLFHQKIYARRPKEKRSPWYLKDRKEKESYRWIEPLDLLAKELPESVKCTVIADREADIHELYESCINNELDFVIRAYRNRTVGSKSKRWEDKKDTFLFEHIQKQKVQSKIAIKLYDSKLKRERLVHLHLRFCKASFPAPWRINWSIKRDIPNLEVYVVELKEHHPPKGASAIHWRLITSLPVTNEEQAIEVVHIYQKRWHIETYHKVIKSGCRVEECRLAKKANLEKYITLCSVVAWRLFWITKVGRANPDAPCSLLFSNQEWRPIYKLATKQRTLPKQVPKAQQTVAWLAGMGGYLARKSDGPPGIITIWRGWQQLNTYLEMKSCG